MNSKSRLTTPGFRRSTFPLIRLDAVAKQSTTKVSASDLNGTEVLHYSIPNVQEFGTALREPGDSIDSDKWLIRQESVLISKLNPRKSTVCLTSENRACIVASTEFVVLAASDRVDNVYLKYVLESVDTRMFLSSLTNSVTRSHERVNPADITKLWIPWPDTPTRRRLVDFLDHETAEIDAFVKDQETLIGLLKERLVSEAFQLVTGSTEDSERRTVDSPFWGSLPVEWDYQKLGWHFRIGNGSTPKSDYSPYWSDDGFPWVNSSVVNDEVVVEPSRRVSSLALSSLHLPVVPKGSLLIGLTGQGRTRGMVTKLGISTSINQHVAFIAPRPGSRMIVDFARTALRAAYPDLRFLSDGHGGTKGALTCESLEGYRVPVPPLCDQRRIFEVCESERAAVNDSIHDANLGIHLAQERRAALISAAVTGQIDVTAKHTPVAEQLEAELAEAR